MIVLARDHNLSNRHHHDTLKLSSMPLMLPTAANKRLPTWAAANSNQTKLSATIKTSRVVSLLAVASILTCCCCCAADNQTNAQLIDKLAGTSMWLQMKTRATANNDRHQILNLNSGGGLSGANFGEAQSIRWRLEEASHRAIRQVHHSATTLKDFAHKMQAKAEPLSRAARSATRDHSGSRAAQDLKLTAPPAALISTAATATPDVELSATEFGTVNYNGLIGINGTDPYAITTESRTLSLPTEIQILMCLLYGTLAFTAIASNMIVCHIVLSNQRMRTATNYFIVNLAVGDILMALLCVPFTGLSNLVYQHWPFGSSLCTMVSYTQTISVFLSSFTMVSISIDKYIAIVHPMRLRMTKNQAKSIILAIWSAALLTSLPTALLSTLTPASPDTGPPPPANSTRSATLAPTTSYIPSTAQATATIEPYTSESFEEALKKQTQDKLNEGHQPKQQQRQQQHQKKLSISLTSGSASGSNVSSRTPPPTLLAAQQQEQYVSEEQKKYFCQESWIFWPPGKYYYSMALMVLQFVLPLFVLIVTYTRIVIIVWGKRMPGEEDNARDARMARSKRKMIKMVIFCVIAFALTWSPFNALIVIGDIAPEIWEHQDIMYIWFITHYLAMCHTITNPLIYIWMNNRFRAGFKQVIGDVCKGLHRLLAYFFFYLLCLGCCFDCSRSKYARVALDLENNKQARRGPLASSGSLNAYQNNSTLLNNATQTTTGNLHTNSIGHTNKPQMSQHPSGGSGAPGASGYSNTTGARATSSGPSCVGAATGSLRPAEATLRQIDGAKTQREQFEMRPLKPPNGKAPPQEELQSGEQRQQQQRQQQQRQQSPSETQLVATSARRLRLLFPRRFLSSNNNSGELDKKPQRRQEANATLDAEVTMAEEEKKEAAREAARSQMKNHNNKKQKKTHRRKQTHVISLQLTSTSQYCRPAPGPLARSAKEGQLLTFSRHNDAYNAAAANNNNSNSNSNNNSKWRLGGRPHARHRNEADSSQPSCPGCSQTSVGSGGRPATKKHSLDGPSQGADYVRFDKFLVDLLQSSQSTATISAQTNNTSLSISPVNSSRASGANDQNSNNTSASLSTNEALGQVVRDEGLQPARKLNGWNTDDDHEDEDDNSAHGPIQVTASGEQVDNKMPPETTIQLQRLESLHGDSSKLTNDKARVTGDKHFSCRESASRRGEGPSYNNLLTQVSASNGQIRSRADTRGLAS